MFHVELRQFPHMAREFNLERDQLDARVVGPWIRGEVVELGDRRWSPEQAKLVIFEGRALGPDEIGMGRGWGNVTKSAEEVTARVLDEARGATGSPPSLEVLKQAVVSRAAQGPLRMAQVLRLAGELEPAEPQAPRLELAGRAVWELLQEERLTLSAGDD